MIRGDSRHIRWSGLVACRYKIYGPQYEYQYELYGDDAHGTTMTVQQGTKGGVFPKEPGGKPYWTQTEECYRALRSVTLVDMTSIEAEALMDLPDLVNVSAPMVQEIGARALKGTAVAGSFVFSNSFIHIGECAFEGTYVTSIDMSLCNVGTMAEGAFMGCRDLREVIGPQRIDRISSYVFKGCEVLERCSGFSGFTLIGDEAFRGCASLHEVVQCETMNQIGSYGFAECGIGRVDLSQYWPLTLGEYAFFGCRELTEFVAPSGLESLPSYIFGGCVVLANCTGISNLVSIGDGAFSDCLALTNMVTRSSTSYLGTSSFKGSGVSRIDMTASVGLFNISNMAFQDCASLTDVLFPSSLTSVGDSSFDGCSLLARCSGISQLIYLGSQAFSRCVSFTHLGLLPVIQHIGSMCFHQCGVSNVDLTGSVELDSIGQSCFSGCEKLVEFKPPNGLLDIPLESFKGCVLLQRCYGLERMVSIGDYAFYGCSSLGEVTTVATLLGSSSFENSGISRFDASQSQSLTEVKENTFKGCLWLTTFVAPSSMQSLGVSAFDGCLLLATFDGFSSLAIIGDRALTGCKSLESLAAGRSLTYVGRESFLASGIVHIDFSGGSSLNNIGQSAFQHCEKLTQVSLPPGMVQISSYAFHGCLALRSVSGLSNSKLATIGDWAFYGCTSLQDITTNTLLKEIGESAFAQCGMHRVDMSQCTSLNFSDRVFMKCEKLAEVLLPNIAVLSSELFSGCSSLASITIPPTVAVIGHGCFHGCAPGLSVTYLGASEINEDIFTPPVTVFVAHDYPYATFGGQVVTRLKDPKIKVIIIAVSCCVIAVIAALIVVLVVLKKKNVLPPRRELTEPLNV